MMNLKTKTNLLNIFAVVVLIAAIGVTYPPEFSIMAMLTCIFKSMVLSFSFSLMFYLFFISDDNGTIENIYKDMCDKYSSKMDQVDYSEYLRTYQLINLTMKFLSFIFMIFVMTLIF